MRLAAVDEVTWARLRGLGAQGRRDFPAMSNGCRVVWEQDGRPLRTVAGRVHHHVSHVSYTAPPHDEGVTVRTDCGIRLVGVTADLIGTTPCRKCYAR